MAKFRKSQPSIKSVLHDESSRQNSHLGSRVKSTFESDRLITESTVLSVDLSIKVFISHSFEDKQIVNALEDSLRGVGVEPYMAEKNPNFGGELPKKIEQEIDSSQAVLVVLTKKGNVSPSVNQEIGYAKKGGKLIVALVEDGVVIGVLLQGIEIVKFTSDRIHEAIQSVREYFDSLTKQETSKKELLTALGVASIIILAFIAGYVVAKMKEN